MNNDILATIEELRTYLSLCEEELLNKIKEMNTSSDDVRDATYTQNLIEINNDIRHCRVYQNSKWVGIFQNKKICNLKLLNK